MLLALLAATAPASPQQELLRHMEDVDADPIVAVSCTPAAPLTRLLASAALPGLDPSTAPDDSWLALLAVDRLATSGVDLDASLSVLLFDEQKLVVDLGFSGTEAQANAFVATLLGLESPIRDRFSWSAGQLLIGGQRLPASLVDVTWMDDRLTVRAGIPRARGATLLRRIVKSHDPGDGCAMTFEGALPRSKAATEAGREPTRVTAMIHLPMAEGAPAKVRFRTTQPVPTALKSEPGPPVGGSTVERPAVLMSIGVSLGDLLLDPTLRDSLDIAEEDVVALLSQVRFGRGTTVAFFADQPRLGFVANLDATRADGRAVAPRRARRVLQRALGHGGVSAERVGPTELRVTLPQSAVWVATRLGGLVVGSDRGRVREAAEGEGAPWIRPAFADLAAAHPVAVRSEGVSTRSIPPVAADLGIRTVGDLWELTFAVQVEEERKASTHAALAATIGAIVLPRILKDGSEPRQ